MYKVDAFVFALSQHYRILKEVIWNGKRAPEPIPESDARLANYITDFIASIGGNGLANYCRLMFHRAWFSWDASVYDIKKILEYIRDHGQKSKFTDSLAEDFDRLVEMGYRLSNPIAQKNATRLPRRRKAKTECVQQLMLFSDEELGIKKQEPPAEETKPKTARRPRNADPLKPRKQRKPRKTKLDKLADEIIDAEYNTKTGIGDDDELDPVVDATDHFSRGYDRMSDTDFGYFSGQEYS